MGGEEPPNVFSSAFTLALGHMNVRRSPRVSARSHFGPVPFVLACPSLGVAPLDGIVAGAGVAVPPLRLSCHTRSSGNGSIHHVDKLQVGIRTDTHVVSNVYHWANRHRGPVRDVRSGKVNSGAPTLAADDPRQHA